MEAATAITPARSQRAPQHIQALEHANRVRIARAELKRAIKDGSVPAAKVIRELPWEAETMTIAELLGNQQRWGRKRVTRFLRSVAVNENRVLAKLTARQRTAVAAALEGSVGAHEREMAMVA